MTASRSDSRITAVLGPTNTGKTYLAIERMLDHESGMIGFPLRLLARENYDRVVRLKGKGHVALVTGEEKIVPRHARYFLCTVESMPLDRAVEFLAVDEIQMCADAERGHVFTDRLLQARGTVETMFLGAETIRRLIRTLVPSAQFVTRPRLSRLSYVGPKKLTRLPPRTAVVAFSVNDVYEVAELLRRQRGGAAVVLGALSPRTRNAQVALYQEGEVDYLVATDAIGMGLNMDIDRVVFARLHKFDGRVNRRLEIVEIAQIAGRAGRHMQDGGFGTTSEIGALDPEIVEAVESHRFDPLYALHWRNSDLDFRSPQALLASLDSKPPRPELRRGREADDRHVLALLARQPEVRARATSRGTLRLLWDVCQIPDFRKTMMDSHARLLARVFGHLVDADGRLPREWVAAQIAALDRPDGDIDTLMARIAHVRTWTFMTHRADWIDDAAHWQARAMAVEERLSDALHDRLTQRFVDRRAAALSRARGKESLDALIDEDGVVVVEGETVGRLDGFRFRADATATAPALRAVTSAANRALGGLVQRRIAEVEAAEDDALTLAEDAKIHWRGMALGRLKRGDGPLTPRLEVIASDLLDAPSKERVRARLAAWWTAHLARELKPLFALAEAPLDGPARGLAFRLQEGLGAVRRRDKGRGPVKLSAEQRRALGRLGVRLGVRWIYLPALLKPRAAALSAVLWQVHQEAPPAAPPKSGAVAVTAGEGAAPGFYEACGFELCGDRAIRIDRLDRLAVRLLRHGKNGAFVPPDGLLAGLGLSQRDEAPALAALGYRCEDCGEGAAARWVPAGGDGARRRPPRRGTRRPPADPHSPFAKLSKLQPA